MTPKTLAILTILAIILAACSLQISPAGGPGEPTATPTIFVTATLPATPTLRPSATPLPPTPTDTVVPISGTTTTKVNVRSEPNTASETLGVLDEFVSVQINGKDPSEGWLRIPYDKGPDGLGWVTARFIRLTGSLDDVPVIGEANGPGGVILGTVTEPINVRSGPGTDFDALDLFSIGDVVTLTGKNSDSTWLQIDYPKGPKGKGWVSASFIKSTGIDSLPIVTEGGAVIGTGTATSLPATPTATVVPAPEDEDSKENPSAVITLSEAGNHSFQYSGDISTPKGDSEDWLELTVEGDQPIYTVYASLACTGNGRVEVKLWEAGQLTPEQDVLACGDTNTALELTAGKSYHLQLTATAPQPAELAYVSYTLKVSLEP